MNKSDEIMPSDVVLVILVAKFSPVEGKRTWRVEVIIGEGGIMQYRDLLRPSRLCNLHLPPKEIQPLRGLDGGADAWGRVFGVREREHLPEILLEVSRPSPRSPSLDGEPQSWSICSESDTPRSFCLTPEMKMDAALGGFRFGEANVSDQIPAAPGSADTTASSSRLNER